MATAEIATQGMEWTVPAHNMRPVVRRAAAYALLLLVWLVYEHRAALIGLVERGWRHLA